MDTTELIRFVDSNKLCVHTHLIDSNLVTQIRKYLREIYGLLYESESASETTGLVRLEILQLASSPSHLSEHMLQNCGLADKEWVARKYGDDTAMACAQLHKALGLFNQARSPLLEKLVEVVSEKVDSYEPHRFKLWCHKNEIETFIELFEEKAIELEEANFIWSLAAYRKTAPFETLVKLGPLRSQGWSKTPKAIISSPRFNKLLSFKWNESIDEDSFGAEPVTSRQDYLAKLDVKEEVSIYSTDLELLRERAVIEPVDDYAFLAQMPPRRKEGDECILFELPGHRGVLLSPGSNQLIFEHQDDLVYFSYRSARDVEPGSFLLIYKVAADLGGNVLVGDIKLAPIWKASLASMYSSNHKELIDKMRTGGIDLVDLDRAAKQWKDFEGDVIHGPQNIRHFQTLIEYVLAGCLGQYTWRQAWDEIQDSRVNAIQYGRIEQSIINDQLLQELEANVEWIREKCDEENFFRWYINSECGLEGKVEFYPILDVAKGFRAPHEKQNVVVSSAKLEIYRI